LGKVTKFEEGWMSFKKISCMLLAILIVFSMLGGCATPATNPESSQTPNTVATTPPTGTSSQSPNQASTSSLKLADKQILRVATSVEPPTLDPSKAGDSSATDILKALNHGLVRFNADLGIEPALAESWQYSADGRSVTFKLRDGIKYSNGKPIKASDFVYSWKRLMDPRTASPYSTMLSPVKGAAPIIASKVPTDTAKLEDLDKAVGVSAPDDRTFIVELQEPFSAFLSLCALWNTVPLDKETIDQNGTKWTQPNLFPSSGPYMLKEWKQQQELVLTPNPYYYGPKPTLQEIHITITPDPKAEFEAFKAGELDVCNRVPEADLASITSSPELAATYLTMPALNVYALGLNVRKAPFDNKLVRQAFSMAIDRSKLCDVIGRGVPKSATSFIPPGMPAYDAQAGLAFDPIKAAKLLADAGYPGGKGFPEITLAYNSSPTHQVRMEFIQDQLKQNLGVTIKLEAFEGAAYLNALQTNTPALFRLGWNADYPHPRAFLDPVFRSNSSSNFGGYKNNEVDSLLNKAASTTVPAEQEKLYKECQKLILDDAPMIFLYWNANSRLVKPWVKDSVLTPMDGNLASMLFLDKVKIAAH
jgi:oligopeptide transport system substrate-binding protein